MIAKKSKLVKYKSSGREKWANGIRNSDKPVNVFYQRPFSYSTKQSSWTNVRESPWTMSEYAICIVKSTEDANTRFR